MKYNPFAKPRHGTEILSGVHLLGTHRVNFFVLEEGRSLTLVDCGFDGHRRYLKEWLSRQGRRLSDVEAILLTHGHADHVGFAERLRRRGVPVFLHRDDVALATSARMRLPPERLVKGLWRASTLKLFGEAMTDGVFMQPVLRSPTIITKSGSLDVPGRPAVVATEVPGHSPGSVAYYVPDRGALFTGDALMSRDPMRSVPDRPMVFAERADANRQAFESLARMRAFSDAAFLPSHGEPALEPGAVGRALEAATVV